MLAIGRSLLGILRDLNQDVTPPRYRAASFPRALARRHQVF